MKDDRETAAIAAIFASSQSSKICSLLPSNIGRSRMVYNLLGSLGLLEETRFSRRELRVFEPRRASVKELAQYHDRDYLEHALAEDFRLSTDESEVASRLLSETQSGLTEDCPPFRGMPDYIELVSGGVLDACQMLREGAAEIAINWDGGRHHAQKSQAAGFCYVADCVLALMTLKKPLSRTTLAGACKKLRPRVMYLDLDLHFSDGVSHAFHAIKRTRVPQVLTLSIHHSAQGFYPVSELSGLPDVSNLNFDPYTISVPLKQGASATTFASIWPSICLIRDAYDPDFVVLQCGVDGLAGDPHAIWNWSLTGPGSLGWCVNDVVNNWPGRKLLLGGGGYDSPNAARAWSFLTSLVAGKDLSGDTDIPDDVSDYPEYGHSFCLDVCAGNMPDETDDNYLIEVNGILKEISHILMRNCEDTV